MTGLFLLGRSRNMVDAEAIISAYGLSPHPEGGWYREYHSSGRVFEDLPGYPGPRVAITAIYFCLKKGEFSSFHRLRSEEVWIHLAGSPLELVLLETGKTDRIRIASVEDGGPPGAIVPAGMLQAARPLAGFTFVSCLVAPGFDFGDFEMASREGLLATYPDRADLIRSLTR
jgi:predicted cupin superfamily sugar epimerase